jgi:phosphatidylinositol alpha-mannosyltransferase
VPDVQLLVAGPGDTEQVRAALDPAFADRVHLLGLVSAADKPKVYASGDVYCAPNTHGESFGIVLIEAMAAGTPVVASDLEAFRRVLDDGDAGVLVPVGDPRALADGLAELLRDPVRRAALSVAGSTAVLAYDWSQVTRQIVEVYETVAMVAAVEVDDSHEDGADDVEDLGQEDDPSRVSETLRRWLAVVRERVAP